MNLIQQITSDPLQKQTIILADGSPLTITVSFRPMQFGWFFEEITWGDVTIEGMRICVSPNMLRQFKNLIPFGIACFSAGNREPTQQDDFSSGAASLYVLSEADVQAYEDILSG